MTFLMYGLILKKGRNCGFLVTVSAILGLSFYQIYKMVINYGGWTLDVSTIIMGNVCKYSLFAYSYEDGGKSDEQLKTKDQRMEKLK